MSDTVADFNEEVIDRESSASNLVRRFTAYAAGTSLIPMPLLDVIATSGVQVKMVRDLSKLYDLEFSQDVAKSIISSLVGTLGAQYVAMGASSMVKVVPFVGQLASIVVAPGLAGAITYGLGRVFMRHFEMGGTLLTFDVDQMREYFKAEVENGKNAATKPRATSTTSSSASKS